MEATVKDTVAFGPGIDDPDETQAVAPRKGARKGPEVKPAAKALPSAVIMTAISQLDLIYGNTISFRPDQRVTDPQLIGFIIERGLPYRVE